MQSGQKNLQVSEASSEVAGASIETFSTTLTLAAADCELFRRDEACERPTQQQQPAVSVAPVSETEGMRVP